MYDYNYYYDIMSTVVSPRLSDRAVSNRTSLLKAPASHPNAMIRSYAVIIACGDPAVAVAPQRFRRHFISAKRDLKDV